MITVRQEASAGNDFPVTGSEGFAHSTSQAQYYQCSCIEEIPYAIFGLRLHRIKGFKHIERFFALLFHA